MTDAKLKNGDISLDSAGRFELLSDSDARFQRALICMSVEKGSFIYDRELGTYLDYEVSVAQIKEKTEQSINEALARFKNTSAKVVEVGEKFVVTITVDKESRTEEVLAYGQV